MCHTHTKQVTEKIWENFIFTDCIDNSIKLKVKEKVRFTLEQATKTQKASRGIDLLFL